MRTIIQKLKSQIV